MGPLAEKDLLNLSHGQIMVPTLEVKRSPEPNRRAASVSPNHSRVPGKRKGGIWDSCNHPSETKNRRNALGPLLGTTEISHAWPSED